MQSIQYKVLELLTLFILLPVSFLISYPMWLKVLIVGCGFVYIIYTLLRIEKYQFKMPDKINWLEFIKRIFLPAVFIFVVTTCYVWFTDKSQLFHVLLNNPVLWLSILFFYSFFSVYPQELIYRTFFFKRYQQLFKSQKVFIIINSALFSLAHIFFINILVIVLTFIGGILFALTYKKTKSTLLVTVEHSIYGCWLFTVGMGDMLGFPS